MAIVFRFQKYIYNMDVIFNQQQLPQIVKQVYEAYKQCKVWAFYADMGCGKTTFIHSLCTQVLQVTEAVSSPTFSIVNTYTSVNGEPIYHMDWYRLKDEEEAMAVGVDDAMYSGNLCLIEWPSIAENLLPTNMLHIELKMVSAQERRLIIR